MNKNQSILEEKLLQANQSKIFAAFKKSCHVSEVETNIRKCEKAHCNLSLFEEKIKQMLRNYIFDYQKKPNALLLDELTLYAVLPGVTDPDISLLANLYKNEINSFYLEFVEHPADLALQ